MFKSKQFIFIAVSIILFSGISVGCKDQNEAATVVSHAQDTLTESELTDLMMSMNIRQITNKSNVPEFRLRSLDGDWIELNEYRGKVVLISFWATW
jgi:hypothetical protein